jgi:hypothetical protein
MASHNAGEGVEAPPFPACGVLHHTSQPNRYVAVMAGLDQRALDLASHIGESLDE